jgi:methyl-accepting chemotaxis protein
MKSFFEINTRVKLIIGFGIIMMSIIVVLIFTNIVFSRIKTSGESIIRSFTISRELTELRADQNRIGALTLEMIVTRDQNADDSMHVATIQRMTTADARIITIDKLLSGSPDILKQFAEIRMMSSNLNEMRKNLLHLIDQGKFEEASAYAMNIQNPFYEILRQKILRLENAIQKDNNLSQGMSQRILRWISIELTLFSAGIIFIAFAFTLALFRLIRKITREIKAGVIILGSSTNEILTTVNEVFTGATETASAVSETTTTIGEIRQTALVATQKAQSVLESSQHASEAAENGKESVRQTIEGMNEINQQMNQIAESVINLSDKNRSIGEITSSVTDIAEQSNLLAVNAAIEAAKAGEHGRGFSVVAQEIRNLAEQSKQATFQVKEILSEIQKSINLAVMATEQGSRVVDEGNRLAINSGEMIDILAESVEEAVQSVMQISTSSQQQMAGIDQIVPAMENIKQASKQNVVGTRQTQNAAQTLNELGQNLKNIIDKYSI